MCGRISGHRLLDIQDMRLREMDKHGVEMMILSLNAPAIQAIHDVKTAIAIAKQANESSPAKFASGPAGSPPWPPADARSGSGCR